jgi:hypothetical protein
MRASVGSGCVESLEQDANAETAAAAAAVAAMMKYVRNDANLTMTAPPMSGRRRSGNSMMTS